MDKENVVDEKTLEALNGIEIPTAVPGRVSIGNIFLAPNDIISILNSLYYLNLVDLQVKSR